MNIINVNSKEYVFDKFFHSPTLLRESNQVFHFINYFVDALYNTMNEFISLCREKCYVDHQFVISFKFDEKKDTVACIFDYSADHSLKYNFSIYGNSFNFRNRKKMLQYIQDLLVKFGCEFSK